MRVSHADPARVCFQSKTPWGFLSEFGGFVLRFGGVVQDPARVCRYPQKFDRLKRFLTERRTSRQVRRHISVNVTVVTAPSARSRRRRNCNQ
jgi:hypothetical protein